MTRRAPAWLAVLLTVACGPGLHPIPANPVTDPDVLLRRMEARRAALTTLSATARMESYARDGVLKGRVTVLADASGRLRVDAWSPTDDLLAALVADSRAFRYVQRGASECLEGGSCRDSLQLLLPLGLDLRDGVGALFGFPPLLPAAGPWTIAFDRRAGAYRLESPVPGGGTQRLWLRDDGTPVAADRDGALGAYRMDVSGFEAAGSAGEWPRLLRFRIARDGRDVTIRYRSLEVGGELPADAWDLECPRGVPVRTLSCEAPP